MQLASHHFGLHLRARCSLHPIHSQPSPYACPVEHLLLSRVVRPQHGAFLSAFCIGGGVAAATAPGSCIGAARGAPAFHREPWWAEAARVACQISCGSLPLGRLPQRFGLLFTMRQWICLRMLHARLASVFLAPTHSLHACVHIVQIVFATCCSLRCVIPPQTQPTPMTALPIAPMFRPAALCLEHVPAALRHPGESYSCLGAASRLPIVTSIMLSASD